MGNATKYIFLILLVLFFSCEDSKYISNCDECSDEEPLETVLSAEFSEANQKGTLVMLYEGRIEDNIVFDSIRIFSTYKYEKRVSINRTYTITATYIINNKSYTVVDSTTPRTKYTETLCEKPCYFVYDRMLDLRLKYTK
ncbi:MAG TPA: hypothetical protein VMV47_11930 [Bacteroidales bacterium]|nr:hypothetical protein [Bacteroidales bacterium]